MTYRPGATLSNTKEPSAPVRVVRGRAPDGPERITLALTTTPPWSSATRPLSDAVWAAAAEANKRMKKAANARRVPSMLEVYSVGPWRNHAARSFTEPEDSGGSETS